MKKITGINSELVLQVKKEMFKRSFYHFFRYMWDAVEPSEYIDNYHIKYICDTLQYRFYQFHNFERSGFNKRSENIKDVIINVCPGSSKSLISSVMFPLWIWFIRPSTKILCASYSYAVAENLAAKRLKVLTSDKYKEIVLYKLESTGVGNIRNSEKGQIYTSSTGGSITGLHFNVILCDDPDSQQVAYSETERLQSKRFALEVLPTRLTNIKKDFIVTIQQRLHMQDTTGVLLSESGRPVKKIIIPAIQNGLSYFPERYPLDFFEQQRKTLGVVAFNSQYLQMVQDSDGGIIKKEWLVFDNELITDGRRKPIFFLDTSYGGASADKNALLGAIVENHNLRVKYLNINTYDFPTLLKFIKKELPWGATIYVEGKASGKSIIQMLKKTSTLNVIEMQPSGSKIQRKHAVSPYFESGRIIIENSIGFKEDLVEQLIYDQVKNDDALDVLMYAIEKLLMRKSGEIHMKFK